MRTAPRRVVVLALLAFSACDGCTKPDDAPPPPDGTAPPVDGQSVGPPGALEEKKPTTMADLHPVLRETGEEGVVPTSIAIELAKPIVPNVKKGATPSAPDGTDFTIEPAVEGRLTLASPTTLVFTPAQPFAYGTAYKATLRAVGTKDGTIAAKGENEVFTRTFTTPEFGFVRLGLHEVEPKKRTAVVDVVFSGPVDAKAAAKKLAWKVLGATAPDMPCVKAEAANVARCSVTAKGVDWGAEIDVVVRAGLPSTVGKKATTRDQSGRLEIPGGEDLNILAAGVREGGTGFVVDVVCSDEGSGPADRYWWHPTMRQSFEDLTPRCVVDEEDALQKIHFTPKVAFSIAAGEHGFRIFGDFARGAYTMRIDAGITSVDKGVLKREFETTLHVPARKPSVSFVAQGRYLPRAAWRSLALRHVNAGAAEITVRHVGAENLVHWMSDDGSEAADPRDSDVVAKKKITLGGVPDKQQTTWIDVGSWLPATTRGVVEVSIRSTENGASDARRLLLTDMNLVAKKSRTTGDVWAWALGIDDNKPLSGVEIRQVAPSGRVMGTCTTGGDGGCRLPGPPKDAVDPQPPIALVAQKGQDLTYLKYADLKNDVAESAVHGVPYDDARPYRAAIWTDRGVYRPGETAHVAMVLRDKAAAAPPVDMPVEVQLVDPKQKVAKKLSLKPNAAGVIAFDQTFSDYADTGSWDVLVLVGGKEIARRGISVEEFVPERMKVAVSPSKKEMKSGDSFSVDVSAQYLFGGSAKGSKFDVECRVEPTVFAPKENATYAYGVWRPREADARALPLGTASGTLDDDGKGSLPCAEMEKAAGFEGAARVVAKVAVFEAGSGRTTQGEGSAVLHPESFYLGLQSGTKTAASGKEFSVEGVVVDWTGAKKSDALEIDVALYRVESEYRWAYDDEGGEWRTHHDDRLVLERKQKVAAKDGRFTVAFTPAQDASAFVVRARAGDARTDLVVDGSWYDWWYGDGEGGPGRDRTPRPTAASDLPLQAPEMVKVGESAVVKTNMPFKGRILFTAETDGVVVHEWKDAGAGEVQWSFTLPKFQPTVYVTAFAVKDPHLESAQAFTPERAFGVAPVRVEPVEYAQKVALTTPKEVRSNSNLEVKVDLPGAEGPTYVTVAAVDEGILSLTKFKSPDPLTDVFEKRALGVDSFETIGWNLLLPAMGPSSSTGGDADSGMGRVQPVKPVALWSGLIEAKGGSATVTFDVPQYRGSLRVMAVAVGPKKMGAAAANVLVRDPIVLQTTLPRFLIRGDEAQVPVFVTNLSGKETEVDVRVTAEPLPVPGLVLSDEAAKSSVIDFVGPASKSLHLKDGASGTVVFVVKGLLPVGAAKLRVQASAPGGLISREDLDVPFAPNAPKTRTVQRIELQKGANDLKPLLQGWMPTTERTTVWVTNNPYGDVFDHMKHLLHYPYGCIEQTTSATRPLLFLPQLIGSVDPTVVPQGGVERFAQAGIERVLSMQTPSGGFGYWPGDREPNLWGTAYATHMLLDAKKLKYPVPQGRIDEAIAFLENEITNRFEKETNWNQAGWWEEYAEPYMHYVLAVAGKPRKARAEKLLEKMVAAKGFVNDKERDEQIYLLKAALWLAGDRRWEADLKNPDASPVGKERKHGWSFYSDLRRRGMTLSVFGELFGADPAGQKLADLVVEQLRGRSSYWYTTQELVWSITGLGRRIPPGAKDWSVPVLKGNGRELKAAQPPENQKTNERSFFVARASEYGDLTLHVDSKDAGGLWAIVTSEGVKPGAVYATGGEGLSLSRSWVDSSGQAVPLGGGAQLGDVVYVVLDVKNTSNIRVENLALVDRFPAGFEIENPRLGRSSAIDFVATDDLWETTYMNLRDDRLEVFGGLGPGQSKKVVYALRAVTAGTFGTPPAEIEAMYDPALWARDSGPQAVIGGPWAEFLE